MIYGFFAQNIGAEFFPRQMGVPGQTLSFMVLAAGYLSRPLIWREMPRRIASLASALTAAGLRPGNHVGTLALNSPLYFELMLAVWWGGGILIPLNTRLAYDELRDILEHSEARFLLTDDTFRATAERTREAVASLRSVIVVDEDRRRDMLAASPMDDAQVALDELACIFYTGGTTGLPKGVELTHSNLAFAALNMQRDLRHDSETVYLHTTPLFHLADFGIGLGVTLAAGAQSFLPHFSAAEVFSRLRTDGITHLQLVPTMLSMLLDAPERDDSLLRRVRTSDIRDRIALVHRWKLQRDGIRAS